MLPVLLEVVIMSVLYPRFEFRAFAQTFGIVEDKIRRDSVCHDIGESTETYLIAFGVEEQNVKVRDGRLAIKRLVERRQHLERWEPVMDEAFPVSRALLHTTLLPALRGREANLGRSVYACHELLDDVVGPRRDVWRACVFKRRFRFTIDECPTEIDELLINGAAIRSVAVESEDAEAVVTVVDKLGLSAYENINYPRAIRRIMGLESLPHEDVYYGQRNRT
jgi:hypothetical protein